MMNKQPYSSFLVAILLIFVLSCTVSHCQETSPKCFGLDASDINVCSGRGLCKETDTCYCRPGYVGTLCQFPTCFGKYKEESIVGRDNTTTPETISAENCKVCSGKGQCTDVDTCVCDEHYSGKECEVTSCFGVSSQDQSVCSENGRCIAHNSCQCKRGFYGERCEKFTCFGIAHDDPKVCAGHGQCVSVNKCSCKPNYEGDVCHMLKDLLGDSSAALSITGNTPSHIALISLVAIAFAIIVLF